MTLRARLSLTIAMIAALLVIPTVFALAQLRALREVTERQRVQFGRAYRALGGLQSSLIDLSAVATEFLIEPAPDKRASMMSLLQQARRHIHELGERGYPFEAARADDRVDSIGVAMNRYELLVASATGDGRIGQVLDAVRMDEAGEVLEDARGRIAATGELIDEIALLMDRRSDQWQAEASDILERALLWAAIALAVCVLVALVLAAWVTRSLTHPIVRLRNAMAVVAGGDFAVPLDLPYPRRDEIGSVSRSFRAMTHRLSDLDRLKGEFLSFATHELRTPLNVVAGYAELLKEGTYGPLSSSQHDAVEAIRDQTRVIAQLVNQLLDIGRLEAGGLRVQIRDAQTGELFQRVERSFDPLARQRGISFDIAIEESVPDTLAVDVERMADQVLGNLLSNALKFTPDGGRIRLHARRLDGALAIEVSDTGPGIPPDKLPQIFEKYYQVSDEARRKGAGLGLSIARDVVRAHGGTIHVESEPGSGTTFRVLLPAGEARHGSAALVRA